PGGGVTSASGSFNVTSAGIGATSSTLTPTEGATFNGEVARFTDAYANTTGAASSYAATITWGDGSTTNNATVTSLGNGVYAVSGSPTYTQAGAPTVSVAVTGPGGGSASGSNAAAVASAGLSATLASISATEGTAFTGQVATFADADAATTSQPSDYTATI